MSGCVFILFYCLNTCVYVSGGVRSVRDSHLCKVLYAVQEDNLGPRATDPAQRRVNACVAADIWPNSCYTKDANCNRCSQFAAKELEPRGHERRKAASWADFGLWEQQKPPTGVFKRHICKTFILLFSLMCACCNCSSPFQRMGVCEEVDPQQEIK